MRYAKYLTHFIFYLRCVISPVNAVEEKNQLRTRSTSHVKNQCTLYWKYGSTEEGEQESLDCEIMYEEKIYRLPLLGLSDEWLDLHKDEIISGESILETRQLDIDSDLESIHVRDDWGFNWHTFLGLEQHQIIQQEHHENDRNDHNRRLVSRSKGKKRTVIVHIRAKDTSTPVSPYELSNQVFGTYGNADSIRSQMKGCSYGQFDIVPSNARGVVNGVYQMNLDIWARGKNQGLVQNAALNHLRGRFGFDLSRTFDHVMICVPEGVGKFIGYAWSNDFLSVFHSDWCKSFTTKIHELGHNIGLQHAGEGTCDKCEYADQSGMMGFVNPASDGPKMCFNGAQSWQLGWYRSKSVTLDPLQQPWDGQLVGVSDYANSSNTGYKVILQLDARRQNIAYYVMFNRKNGVNEGTNEGANEVLLTSQVKQSGNLDKKTTLLAKLDAGDRYIIRNYNKSGEDVVIRVNQIHERNGFTWSAAVTVDSSIAPLRKYTPSPTPSPTPVPVPVTREPDTDRQIDSNDLPLAVYNVSSKPTDCKAFNKSECSKGERHCLWDIKTSSCLGSAQRFRYQSHRKKVRSGNPREQLGSASWDG